MTDDTIEDPVTALEAIADGCSPEGQMLLTRLIAFVEEAKGSSDPHIAQEAENLEIQHITPFMEHRDAADAALQAIASEREDTGN